MHSTAPHHLTSLKTSPPARSPNHGLFTSASPPHRPSLSSPASHKQAFAAAWQDDSRLLVGTKCNRLLQWDVADGALREVPLPPAPPREHEVLETLWGSCGECCWLGSVGSVGWLVGNVCGGLFGDWRAGRSVHTCAMGLMIQTLLCFHRTPSPGRLLPLRHWNRLLLSLCPTGLAPPPLAPLCPRPTVQPSTGIHSVCVNPAADMVVTGGTQPADCVVLRLPDFQPVQTLVASACSAGGCVGCGARGRAAR